MWRFFLISIEVSPLIYRTGELCPLLQGCATRLGGGLQPLYDASHVSVVEIHTDATCGVLYTCISIPTYIHIQYPVMWLCGPETSYT